MNAADESLGNVLLVGLGAVAIQVALDLRRHGAGRLGALNHPGRRSQRIAEALARGACLQLEGQGQHRWLSGNAALDVFHQDPAELRDDWQTLVLCVPADSYLDVVRGLPWERLGGVRTLLLVSAFIGANLLVRSALPAGCQATVLSLSSYYAATKVIDETQPLRALTKAVKEATW
ncbi:pseudopaline biosynthesis dehydrogenase CntM, partial [Pseudomonas aeruginosa]